MACNCQKKANVVESKRYVVVFSGELVENVSLARRFISLTAAEKVKRMNPGSAIVVA